MEGAAGGLRLTGGGGARGSGDRADPPKKPKAPVAEPLLVSVPDAARMIGVDPKTIRRWEQAEHEGFPRAVKLGREANSRRMFRVSDLRRWVDRL